MTARLGDAMEPTGRLTIEKMREIIDTGPLDPQVQDMLIRSLIEWVENINDRLGGV